jgi:hypothetical protein
MSTPDNPSRDVHPESPLHKPVAPFSSSTSNDIRQDVPGRRSASIDEPVVVAASSSGRGGSHRSRPSTSALLGGETSAEDDFADETFARDRQRRLRSYEDDDDVGGVRGVWRRTSAPFRGIQSAFKKNEGAFSPPFPPCRAILTTCSRRTTPYRPQSSVLRLDERLRQAAAN